MEKVIHKADSRGHANYGWLDTWHTFSFARYFDPERMHFGALRVLNDDTVAAGQGFGTHPHDNMEIISVPLSGDLEHKDSMGNITVIRHGEVQVMSAGTGIMHSEYNKNDDSQVKFLQIWVIPDKQDVKPRYDQISLTKVARDNELFQILSPSADDEGVWINQQAWFHMGYLKQGWQGQYTLRGPDHGVYVFMIEGEANIAGIPVGRRDGIGLWHTKEIDIEVSQDCHILLMEVPMLQI